MAKESLHDKLFLIMVKILMKQRLYIVETALWHSKKPLHPTALLS